MEWLELLNKAVNASSQAEVSRKLGVSSTTISLVLKGKYGASTDAIEKKVREVYGNESVDCPVMGEIALALCAEKRRLPFSASSPLRVRLFKACKVCEFK
ncbi:MAG: helix-turn-helix domain-containing protein [Deltaproteobacteria bacterium]|nr:helix-turn-helix domain-containing protein [Deltaproteobacteria bacterium]